MTVHPQGAIMVQPGQPQVQWMQPPPPPLGCPPGLEYLGMVDQILCKQKIELLEIMSGWETNNHYVITNTVGQQIYTVDEESGLCMRQCCGPSRGFVLHVVDNMNQEVMRITREFKCCAGCYWCANFDCCAYEISIEAPVGTVIGYTRQQQSCIRIMLEIMNENRERIFTVEGPICACGCSDVEFPVSQ